MSPPTAAPSKLLAERPATTSASAPSRAPKNGAGSVRLDLLEIGWVRAVVRSRLFQPLAILPNLAIFVILIMAGLVGNPIGNQNAAIIMIWIFWFFFLIMVLVPLGGRAWCLMCPLPAPAEWISRLGIVQKVRGKAISAGWKWPKKLDNIWLQNVGFLLVASLSPLILTRPAATSYLMLLFIGLAIVTHLLFIQQNRGGRIFCKYVCPVGGFIGLYSLMGGLEIKVKDKAVCKSHREKVCVTGNECGWGCPWFEYPGNMERNLYCGLCTECIKTCPKDNLAFGLRPLAADLTKKRKLDEAYKSFIMLGSALAFIAIFFGWWGSWKDVANPIDGVLLRGPVRWGNLAVYTAAIWTLTLIVIPGIHLGVAALARALARIPGVSLKKLFVDYAYALVPLGLAVWMAFVLGMIMVNGAYVVSVISDPFGWGWDVFGTAGYKWRPYFPGAVPYLQLIILVVGAVASTRVAGRLSWENFPNPVAARRATLPLAAFIGLLTAVFTSLFVMA